MKEILIENLKDKKTPIIKFEYTDENIYNRMLSRCRKWEEEGKIKIIPQNINDFIETGIKI